MHGVEEDSRNYLFNAYGGVVSFRDIHVFTLVHCTHVKGTSFFIPCNGPHHKDKFSVLYTAPTCLIGTVHDLIHMHLSKRES